MNAVVGQIVRPLDRAAEVWPGVGADVLPIGVHAEAQVVFHRPPPGMVSVHERRAGRVEVSVDDGRGDGFSVLSVTVVR